MSKGTRSVILEKARELFSRHGYDATSMEDIAGKVGIRKASLYAHFPGKQAIFREVFMSVLNGYSAHLEEAIGFQAERGTMKEQLFGVFSHYAAYFTDADAMSFWYRAYMTPPTFMKTEIFNRTMKVEARFVDRLSGFFREGMERGDLKKQRPAGASMAFYLMLMGFGMMAAFTPGVDKSIRECLDVLWNGIGPAAGSRARRRA